MPHDQAAGGNLPNIFDQQEKMKSAGKARIVVPDRMSGPKDHDVKKLAVILLLAVLGPSLLLAVLAVRSLHEQENSVQRQRMLLHQGASDDLAQDVNSFMIEVRRHYQQLFDQLLQENGPDSLAAGFDDLVRARWPQVSLGCVISETGTWESPRLDEKDSRLKEFFLNNMGMFNGGAEVEFFLAPALEIGPVGASQPEGRVNLSTGKMQTLGYAQRQMAEARDPLESVRESWSVFKGESAPEEITRGKKISSQGIRPALESRSEGQVGRYLDDGLHLLLWRKHSAVPGRFFWVELNVTELRKDLAQLVRRAGEGPRASEVFLALLDAGGDVVGRTHVGIVPDWSKPLISTSMGESLPGWQVAAYLLDPLGVQRTAHLARLTIWVLTPVLVLAIILGSLFVFRDIGREMRLARQKTDFVSHVSHELKTPLTSIRMFSEMLGQAGQLDPSRRTGYAAVISREASRLGRLIENLLSFARMERGEARYQREIFDMGRLVSQTIETCRFRAEAAGLKVSCKVHALDHPCVDADPDAISRILDNLVSNAEKYAPEGGELEVEVSQGKASRTIETAVQDRGPGVPRRYAEKIFDKFFRIDDSLSYGIQGSGLGLTLARQIARAHGGDLIYRPRDGGGSCFLLTLPSLADTVVCAENPDKEQT